MASGNVIGGGNFQLGEAYAQAANQNRAQALQAQAMQQQAMMERARLQQSQRQSDMQNQLEYARMNQAANEAQASRQFAAQQMAASQGFQSGENALERSNRGELEQARLGSAKELQGSAQDFQGEQNKAHIQATKDLETQRQTIASKIREVDLAREDAKEKKMDTRYLDHQKEQLLQQEIENGFKRKSLEQSGKYQDSMIAGQDEAREYAKTNQTNALAEKKAEFEARNDPNNKYRADYLAAYKTASAGHEKMMDQLSKSFDPKHQKLYADILSKGNQPIQEQTQMVLKEMYPERYKSFQQTKQDMAAPFSPQAAEQWRVGAARKEKDDLTVGYEGALSDAMPWYSKAMSYGGYTMPIPGAGAFVSGQVRGMYTPEADALLQARGVDVPTIVRAKDSINEGGGLR